MQVDKSGVPWSDKIVLPYEPFVGTIGDPPKIEAISSLQPDYRARENHIGQIDVAALTAHENLRMGCGKEDSAERDSHRADPRALSST